MNEKRSVPVSGAGKIAEGGRRLKKKLYGYVSSYISEESGEGTVSLSRHLSRTAAGLGFGALALIFGMADMMFGIYPMAAALLCAQRRYVPYIFVGSLISSVFVPGQALPLFLMYLMGIILRILGGRYGVREKRLGAGSTQKKAPLFCESCTARALTAGAMAFLYGMYRCIAGGFLYYDVFAALAMLITTPVITVLYAGALDGELRFTSRYDVGMLSLLASAVFSLNGAYVLGFSLSAVAAFFLTLYVSRECGTLKGGVVGLVCGLAFNVLYSPAFALAGLAAGLFSGVGAWISTLAGAIASVAAGVYLGGLGSLTYLAPDILCASLIFCPVAHLDLLPGVQIYGSDSSPEQSDGDRRILSDLRHRDTETRLAEYSQAFTSLSEVFYNLSDRCRRPGIYQIRQRIDRVFREHCDTCTRNPECWEAEYDSTCDALNDVATALYKNGRLTEADIPGFLRYRCPDTAEALKELNMSYSNMLREAVTHNRTEVFAMDYDSVSKLLECAVSDGMKEYEIDTALTKKLKTTSMYLNFNLNNIAAYGTRRKNIIAGGIDLSRVRLTGEEIRRSFQKICGVRLGNPEFSMENDYITMSISQARDFAISWAKADRCKPDEKLNGDTTLAFENREDYFYSLISDGMGSGREAAVCSRLCCVFLEKMLRCGNRKAITLEMLNNFIRSKNTAEECFATVDLFEADLLSGESSFIKAGAAPSYVLRQGSLFKITSNSMPVGITHEINAQEIRLSLEYGDIIVMISDGIAQTFEEGIWIADLLSESSDDPMMISLQDAANKILEYARHNNSEGNSDDMTVTVMRAEKGMG